MTLPIERTWAVERTREFLMELCDSKATPKVPKEIRVRAGRLLKHFPIKLYLELSQEKCPEVWGSGKEFK